MKFQVRLTSEEEDFDGAKMIVTYETVVEARSLREVDLEPILGRIEAHDGPREFTRVQTIRLASS